ncbi:MAG: type II toxin-antitoxin system RelE/ParE family toxin [Nodosilinea sp. WJT8-NPBG4]|jgi:proteic killer suppression protein|nr:type II toxin-antitoxin system RelE/ParE family toxin [Nodosilinea sp. WJT8-NPBG4]
MIHSFCNQGTEDIFNGKSSKAARAICPQTLWKRAARKLDQIDSAAHMDDLKIPPGNRLEALQGNRAGQYSIRINEQYRICFRWIDQGATEVEVVDYH